MLETMLKIIVLALFLSMFALLSAGQDNNWSETEIIEDLTTRLFDILPTEKPLYINHNTYDFDQRLIQDFKAGLFNRNHTILERVSEGVYLLDLNYKLNRSAAESLSTHRFIYKLTDSENAKIIDYKIFEYEFFQPQQRDSFSYRMQWYDPVIVTALVGGLVYMFYYGNK